MIGTTLERIYNKEIPPSVLFSKYTPATANFVMTAENKDMSSEGIPSDNIYPIWRVTSAKGEWEARTPIGYRIYQDGKYFFAENDELALCGNGLSAGEAVDDFMEHLSHFVEYYHSLPTDKFIGLGLKLKKIFEATFTKCR